MYIQQKNVVIYQDSEAGKVYIEHISGLGSEWTKKKEEAQKFTQEKAEFWVKRLTRCDKKTQYVIEEVF